MNLVLIFSVAVNSMQVVFGKSHLGATNIQSCEDRACLAFCCSIHFTYISNADQVYCCVCK